MPWAGVCFRRVHVVQIGGGGWGGAATVPATCGECSPLHVAAILAVFLPLPATPLPLPIAPYIPAVYMAWAHCGRHA